MNWDVRGKILRKYGKHYRSIFENMLTQYINREEYEREKKTIAEII